MHCKCLNLLLLSTQVDIVFESEDESFYAALSTLILTSKRPVIMTLGSTDARALDVMQDKIKSQFTVVEFNSPDLSTACNYRRHQNGELNGIVMRRDAVFFPWLSRRIPLERLSGRGLSTWMGCSDKMGRSWQKRIGFGPESLSQRFAIPPWASPASVEIELQPTAAQERGGDRVGDWRNELL